MYKRAHLGVSPVAWLAVSLLLHGAGDVVILLFGVVESMPLFLMGHVLYCRSFARGCDVSTARFRRLGTAKKIALFAAFGYAYGAWLLLAPAFESSLRPVLACYIIALVGMFNVKRKQKLFFFSFLALVVLVFA